MLISENQAELLSKTPKGNTLIYHAIEAIVVDSLSGLMSGNALDALVSMPSERRDKWATYPVSALEGLAKLKKINDLDIILLAGQSGTGKTYSMGSLFIDFEKEERKVQEITLDNGTVKKAIKNIIYLNPDNKPPTFLGSDFVYRNRGLNQPEVGYIINTEEDFKWFDEIARQLNLIQKQNTKEKLVTIKDPYREDVFHVFFWASKPTLILLAHLIEEGIYTPGKNPQRIGTNHRVNFFGNVLSKMDFEGNFNYVVYSVYNNGYKYLLHRNNNNTIRLPKLEYGEMYMDNNMESLLKYIRNTTKIKTTFLL